MADSQESSSNPASLLSRMGGLSTKEDEGESSSNASASAASPAPATAATAGANSDAGTKLANTLEEVFIKLADKQGDESSPLYSAKSFEDLNLSEELKKGIYKMGFQKPSKIQERALPLLLQNPPRNLVGQSQSGTGKTCAFVLNMLSRVDPSIKNTQCICVAPTRELADQIKSETDKMGEFTKVTSGLFVKTDSPELLKARWAQIDREGAPQIAVGTPGSLSAFVSRASFSAKDMKVFVLDEADALLGPGSGQLANQTVTIRNAMGKTGAPKSMQIVMFSATFPGGVQKWMDRFAPDANQIMLQKTETQYQKNIKQFFLDVDNEQAKFDTLVELYGLLSIGSSVIFVNRREAADEIARRMTAEGHQVSSLHGQQTGAERDEKLESFRSGKSKVLIATNVLSRGVDVPQVTMVINYDLPSQIPGGDEPHVVYLHRIGRAGRFGRTGLVVNLIHDQRSFLNFEDIRKKAGINDDAVRLDSKNFPEMEKVLEAALKSTH